MTLIYLFDVKIFCVHIGEEDVWDKANIVRLKKHFNKEYHGFAVECLLLQNTDVIQGLQDFIHEKGIDLIAMTTHKRNFITKFLNPSLTRKMLFHSNTPILVFHSEVDN